MQTGETGLKPVAGLSSRLKLALDNSTGHCRRLGSLQWSLIETAKLLDSANIQGADWEALAKQCLALKEVDGIVIIHGTDTMAYSSSALAYFLQNIKIPVVLTGSQKPLETKNSDALDNLVGAMLETKRAMPGVWVYFNQKCLPGARAVKKDAVHFAGFAAPRLDLLGNSQACESRIEWQEPNRDWSMVHVGIAHMTPGYDARHLASLIRAQPCAIILSLFGLGTLADENKPLLAALETARTKGILVVAVSQCYVGKITFSVYAAGSQLSRLGVISGHDITLEAAYAKLMVLFRMGYPAEQIKALFVQNLASDISPEIAPK